MSRVSIKLSPFVLDHTGQEATHVADLQGQDLTGPVLMKNGSGTRNVIAEIVILVVGIVTEIVMCP